MEDKDAPGGGISVSTPEAEISPPLSGVEEAEQAQVEAEAISGKVKSGKVPLHPAAVRLPFSVGGRVLHELTEYPGFEFSDRELQDIAEIWIECGLEVHPVAQALLATLAMLGVKVGGYATWRRAGKPGLKETKPEEAAA